jgi:hypothetical protein
MKRLALTTIALALAVNAFAQGTIAINNRVSGTFLAPVYGVIPGSEAEQRSGQSSIGIPAGGQSYGSAPLLSGTGFTLALFGGPNASSLQFAGQTTFRTGTGAGYVIAGSPTVMIPGVPAGQTATLQVRAWDNANGTVADWTAALARKANGLAQGQSAIFTSRALGGIDAGGGIVLPPDALYGMESFNLTSVPEPSTIALGILGGLGTLVLFRRRK